MKGNKPESSTDDAFNGGFLVLEAVILGAYHNQGEGQWGQLPPVRVLLAPHPRSGFVRQGLPQTLVRLFRLRRGFFETFLKKNNGCFKKFHVKLYSILLAQGKDREFIEYKTINSRYL